jgi:ribonuclease III
LSALPADKHAALRERLGYRFAHPEFLMLALSHASNAQANVNNERLEFLGDRVLGLVIAEELYNRLSNMREGHMAARLSSLVSGKVCAAAAESLGLRDELVLGGGAAQRAKITPAMMGDVMEAVIAAIYLDGGIAPAKALILKLWEPYFDDLEEPRKDPKTHLQEWALSRALPLPAYSVLKREGPDHQPMFSVKVALKGFEEAQGAGNSKRVAEQAAAQAFIQRESIHS